MLKITISWLHNVSSFVGFEYRTSSTAEREDRLNHYASKVILKITSYELKTSQSYKYIDYYMWVCLPLFKRCRLIFTTDYKAFTKYPNNFSVINVHMCKHLSKGETSYFKYKYMWKCFTKYQVLKSCWHMMGETISQRSLNSYIFSWVVSVCFKTKTCLKTGCYMFIATLILPLFL